MKFRRCFTAGTRPVRSRVPDHYLPWLLDTASLTQRLVDACRGEFRVQVLHQAWGRPQPDEARVLGMGTRGRALVRQVRLVCNGQSWVYARTILPRTTLTGAERRLAYLKSRSLGAVLFADPTLQRERIEIAPLHPGDRLYVLATDGLDPPPEAIWGRRTVFRLHGKPLLVSEYFLPGIGAFAP